MFSYQWDWTSYITVFTGQEQLRYWAKLYWRFFLKVFRWTWNWTGTEDSWADPHHRYPPVQALFLFVGNRFIALLMEIQHGSGADSGVFSLGFTMLLGVCLSFLCLPSSCWTEYGRVILLGFDSYIMPYSWGLAIFFDSCGLPDSYRCPRTFMIVFLDLHVSCGFLFLVVFRTLVSLPDSFWPSWLSKCLHI
jgi:hypothetical protein